MPEPNVRSFRRDLSRWGRENRRSFPWRETNDPFRILVAEVLLQRSRGKTVARVYELLFSRWPTGMTWAMGSIETEKGGATAKARCCSRPVESL